MAYIRFYLENVTESGADLMYETDMVKIYQFSVTFSPVIVLKALSGPYWESLTSDDDVVVSDQTIMVTVNSENYLSVGSGNLLANVSWNMPNVAGTEVCLDNGTAECLLHGHIHSVQLGLPGSNGCYMPAVRPGAVIMTPFPSDTFTPGQTFEYEGSFTDYNGTGLSVVWTFGDGNQAYAPSGTHTYDTPGTYTITVRAMDDANKLESFPDSITVTVEQPQVDTPPTITLLEPSGTIIHEAGTSFMDPGALATDAQDGVIPVTIVNNTVDENTVGNYSIMYSATDSAGNTVAQTRFVEVVDTTPPVITLGTPGNITLPYGTTEIDFQDDYVALDAVDGYVAVNTEGTFFLDTPGVYTITYSASDLSGNVASITRTITVEASPNPPVITLVGDNPLTLTVGTGPYEDPGYSATDPEDGVATVTISGDYVDTDQVGTYTIYYDAADVDGNNAVQKSRTVNVIPAVTDTPPVINITGKYLYDDPLVIDMGSAWSDPGVSATDNEDGVITVITNDSGLNINAPGTYYIDYSATDSDGNTATAQRVVVVADNAEPILTLNGDATITLVEGDSYTDAGATATDGGGDISDRIVVTGAVDTSIPNVYTITYNVSDASGNAATPVTRTVTVEAYVNAPPTISLVGSDTIMIEVYGGSWTEPGYTASDSEDGDLTSAVVVTYALDGADVTELDDNVDGVYTITYTVTDSHGGTATATRTVNVGEHSCPRVEDLEVPAGTPNLSGLAVVANGLMDYNGTTIDVSGYTSGMWASLAQNVGLSDTYISSSALNVLQIMGEPITNTTFWENFPISGAQSLNITAYAQDRTFGQGIAITETQTAPVEETVIKFISYMGDRRVDAASSLRIFEQLASYENSYPFNWHCALDSKFAAQDVSLLASSSYGIHNVSKSMALPHAFVAFRFNEMLTRGDIDHSTYHRKMYGTDGSGLLNENAELYSLEELASKSPKRAAMVESDLKTNYPISASQGTPAPQAPAILSVTPSTSAVYDLVHNNVSPTDPSVRVSRVSATTQMLGDDPTLSVTLSAGTLVRAINNYLTESQSTPTYLGGLYTAESSRQRPRQSVLDAIQAFASANGIDIASYT